MNPNNDIFQQLAVLRGELLFLRLFIGASQQVIHRNAQAIRQRGDGRMGRHTLSGFPERDSTLRDACKIAEFFLGKFHFFSNGGNTFRKGHSTTPCANFSTARSLKK